MGWILLWIMPLVQDHSLNCWSAVQRYTTLPITPPENYWMLILININKSISEVNNWKDKKFGQAFIKNILLVFSVELVKSGDSRNYIGPVEDEQYILPLPPSIVCDVTHLSSNKMPADLSLQKSSAICHVCIVGYPIMHFTRTRR